MESDFSDFTYGEVAQQVERKVEALGVTGSIPVLPTGSNLFNWREIDGGFVCGNHTVLGVVDKNL